MHGRRSILSLLFALLVFDDCAAAVRAGSKSGVLTNVAQIRALSVGQAAEHPPAQLRGVLTLSTEDSVVLMDETAGLYLAATNGILLQFQVGDVLSVSGVVDPGKFAPIVMVSEAVKTGHRDLPDPLVVTFSELQSGHLDAQWIEVSGVVRRSEPSEDDEGWQLWVATGGRHLAVRLSVEQGRAVAVDSQVRLRGVCFFQFNKARQVVSPVLQIPRGEPVAVLRSAPADPFSVAERPAGSLLQFNAENLFTHRVRVSGVVTHAEMGEGFWIRSGANGLWVRSLQKGELRPGDKVNVLGFLSRGEYSPALEDAVFRKHGKSDPPSPLRLSDSEEALDHDEDLVELIAEIRESWLVMDGYRLTLMDDKGRFSALLRLNGKAAAAKRSWVSGSRVLIVGICVVRPGAKEATAAGTVEPGSFQVLLRSPEDVVVLQPPPIWTAARVGWLVASVMGLLLATGGFFSWIHRRRAARQVAEMKLQAALAAERARIARDLHDEIGANLTHISILSTLASQSLVEQPESARRHSMEAASAAQQTIRAFDEVLWSVNPKNDTVQSLSHYICRYAEETLAPAGIAYHFELDESYPNVLLPPNRRHGLLLAVKEVVHTLILA